MEVYEVVLILTGNNHELFEKNKEFLINKVYKTAMRIEELINSARKFRGLKSKLIFFYTHKPEEKKIIDDCINEIDKLGLKPRTDSYIQPKSFSSLSKSRIEIAYTNLFAEKLDRYIKHVYPNKILMENYKHFYQIFNGSNILPLDLFKINLVGLIPPPSLNSSKEMDKGQELFLGKGEEHVKLQLDKAYLTSLGSYLLALSSWEEISNYEIKSILEDTFKKRISEKNELIKATKDMVVKKLKEIIC